MAAAVAPAGAETPARMLGAPQASLPGEAAGAPGEAAARNSAAERGSRVEVAGARTDNTTLWANPDGTMSLETHAGPVRFRRDGAWVPVDATLVKKRDGSVQAKAHPKGLKLAGRTPATGGDLVTLGSGDRSVALGWKGPLPDPVLEGPRATYVNVLPATDLVVEATRTGFEQYLVVKNRSAAQRAAAITLPVRAKGIDATQHADTSVTLTDERTGRTVGKLPTPYMWDASRNAEGRAGTHRAPVGMDVTPQGDGFDLKISADRDFLADKNTAYPVTIDPAVYFGANFDTTVVDGVTGDLSGEEGLRVGKEWQKTEARSFIQFPRSSAVTGKDVLNAELNLYATWSDSCEQRSWEIWDTGTVTASTRWSSQPSWRSKVATSDQTHGNTAGGCGTRWLSEDITPLVQQWSTVDRATDTVGLRATDAADTKAYKIFASGDDPVHAPSVLVTYETPADPVKDHVVYWNDVLQQAYRQVGGAPGPLSRAGAMVHGAIYDAANSASCGQGATRCLGAPYLIKATPSNGAAADINSAIDHAAFDVLRSVYPQLDFDDELAAARATIPAGVTPDQRAAGTSVGQQAAAAMLTARQNDGSSLSVPYPGSQAPGYWRPTDSDAAATPGWGRVKPFGATTGSQFRPAGPAGHSTMAPLLASSDYAAQVKKVKDLGGAESTLRTADQTQAAMFWANDLDGTYKPPGQLFEFTQTLSRQQGMSVHANAKFFALAAFAMADAGIAAWDAKYETAVDLWRPESAIRLDGDGNAATIGDPNWQPLSQDRSGRHFSPAFPAYVSGHATFGGAWATSMRTWFGTDDVRFTGTTEDPQAIGVTRDFSSFTEAAQENAIGRVWLGVHYEWDGTDGVTVGNRAAEVVSATELRPNTASAWITYESLANLGGCDALGKRLVAEHRWTSYQCTQVNPPEPGHVLHVK
ncbi:DNRLRE domain-containing protein [Streptomyces atroolivaceus]|uniref:DNRLRE domain-containing protein n=1 Tax=Streptomyces atroolivaceus TaxID=66869 RepID=UPI00379F19B5